MLLCRCFGVLGLLRASRSNPLHLHRIPCNWVLENNAIYSLHFNYFAIPQNANLLHRHRVSCNRALENNATCPNPLHRHCISCNWALEYNDIYCTSATYTPARNSTARAPHIVQLGARNNCYLPHRSHFALEIACFSLHRKHLALKSTCYLLFSGPLCLRKLC